MFFTKTCVRYESALLKLISQIRRSSSWSRLKRSTKSLRNTPVLELGSIKTKTLELQVCIKKRLKRISSGYSLSNRIKSF